MPRSSTVKPPLEDPRDTRLPWSSIAAMPELTRSPDGLDETTDPRMSNSAAPVSICTPAAASIRIARLVAIRIPAELSPFASPRTTLFPP